MALHMQSSALLPQRVLQLLMGCLICTMPAIHAAKKLAELLHVYHRPLTNVDYLFGILFAQSRARIGVAVAKGMSLRALCTSAMGVSKVFLWHVAPARYRDQDLASGPHFLAGMSSCAMPILLSMGVCSRYMLRSCFDFIACICRAFGNG
jgi:hypothetical protein